MTAPTHQVFGGLFGLISFTVCLNVGFYPPNLIGVVLLFFFILVGSLLPDIDHPKSKIGSKFPFILLAIPLYFIFGHRNGTHSPFFVIALFLFTFIPSIMVGDEYLIWISIGITIGTASHVIGDAFFDGGIPWLYPISKERYKMKYSFKTYGVLELPLFMLITLLDYVIITRLIKSGAISSYLL